MSTTPGRSQRTRPLSHVRNKPKQHPRLLGDYENKDFLVSLETNCELKRKQTPSSG